jgi:hypothetical protein
MPNISDHPDDFDREWALRAWRRSGRGGASASFARNNQAQSGSLACMWADVLEGAVPTQNDAAARISFEVRDAHHARSSGSVGCAGARTYRFDEVAGAHRFIEDPRPSGRSCWRPGG